MIVSCKPSRIRAWASSRPSKIGALPPGPWKLLAGSRLQAVEKAWTGASPRLVSGFLASARSRSPFFNGRLRTLLR
jgi:hypothetical protein